MWEQRLLLGGPVLATPAVPWPHASRVSPSGSTTDVHTVASLLKLYLRELPEPVVPFARYEDFLSCAQLLTKDEGEVSGSRGPALGGGPAGEGCVCVESRHRTLTFIILWHRDAACSLLYVGWGGGAGRGRRTLWGRPTPLSCVGRSLQDPAGAGLEHPLWEALPVRSGSGGGVRGAGHGAIFWSCPRTPHSRY